MSRLKIMCPCLFGLESVLTDEIKKIGGQDITTDNGKVSFFGGYEEIVRANLWLRTAERVLLVLGEFRAQTFEELFQGVKDIEWEALIGRDDAFPVKGWSLNSKLHSVPDCQSIIKKAIVDRLQGAYGISWFSETGSVFQVQFSIMKDKVTVSLDTSGAGLHKRGYRRNTNEAPIKETLAAGIVNFARVHGDSVVYDPFCGSGTLLIEAAMRALHIAPGINRRFAAERWSMIPDTLWETERRQALACVDRQAQFRAYGADIDPQAVALSLENARKAGVSPRLKIEQRDVRDFETVSEKSTIICNPPYGERLLEVKEAEELYRVMGQVFKKGGDRSMYIISPHEQFEQIFGSPADRRRKLYNGMIKCQLFMYFNKRA